MERKFLEDLGIEKDTIDKILGENMSDIGKAKGDFDQVKIEADGLRDQLKTAGETIDGFKELDVDGIKQAAKDWEDKYTKETAALTDRLNQQVRDSKIDFALMGAKAKNVKAARALLDMEKISLDGENLIGLQEQLSTVTKENAYLFDVTGTNPPPPVGGGTAHEPGTLQSAVAAALQKG